MADITRQQVKRAVARLFTNGYGERVLTLVLTGERTESFGWSEPMVVDSLCASLGIDTKKASRR